MKKLVFAALILFSATGAIAQTAKKSKKSKKPNREAAANAKFAKQEEQKQLLRDSTLASYRLEDSLRYEADSLALVQLETDRVAYRESGIRNIDSLNLVQYKAMAAQRSEADRYAYNSSQTLAAANLSAYQRSRISTINAEYNDKAAVVTADAMLAEKDRQQQLYTLNEERLTKIRAVAGNSKAKKLEKERKAMAAKNADMSSAWIGTAESYAVNR